MAAARMKSPSPMMMACAPTKPGSPWMREELARYQSDQPCRACNGNRLKPQALAVKIDKLHISEVANFSIQAANTWFTDLEPKLTAKQREIAARILKEIKAISRCLAVSRSEEHT